MAIRCPHCQHVMELKGAKAGRFHPRCTACKQKFLLQIFPEPDRAPMVAIEHDAKAETLSPVVAYALGVTQRPQPHAAQAPARIERGAPSNVQTAAPSPVHPAPAAEESQYPQTITPDHDNLLGDTLGGYHITRKLGQGGMGAVYLARQISLDRNVAVKVLPPGLASDPQFVARFTREAYAAAQLSHHNVVQIHDIGAEHDVHFFSMEFVEGQTLASVVDESGKVDPEQAVGFILQAARGLKYAHDHGLIHRDIKPENLMLNDQGLVKVADLGLVKRQGTSETIAPGVVSSADHARNHQSPGKTEANMSMGTPAYMSPEQSVDAAKVDQRADIYSLGCTMYDLLTGRPPFVGRTALEVITKHQREAIVPPDVVVKHVPKSLSAILLKMVAKQPEQRYQTMQEVIAALEDFLGVATAGPFTPKEEHVKILGFSVERFNASKFAKLRKLMIGAFFLLCAALAVLIGATRDTPLRKVQFTGAFVGLAVLTALAYFVTTGITQRTHLFMKVRQWIFGASFADWLMAAAAVIGVGFVLWVFDQYLPWLIVAGIAVLLAAAFHFTIDLLVSRERNAPLTQVETMLKQMRTRGLDENALRQFISKSAGRNWEEFYENLFGYEAKLQARTLWGRGERGRERPKFAAWRDPIVRAIEARLAMRRELRERRLLAKIEAKALRAKGIREDIANKQARNNARDLVTRAGRLRSSKPARNAETLTPSAIARHAQTAAPGTVMVGRDVALEGAIAAILWGGSMESAGVRQTHGEDDDEHTRVHESWFKRRYGTPIDLMCSPGIRVILAVIILITFTLWWKQNGLQHAAQQTGAVIESRREIPISGSLEDLKRTGAVIGDTSKQVISTVAAETGTRPLHLFPESWETLNRGSEFFGGWNAGLAGALLLFSAFFSGRIMALLVVSSAGVAMAGHRFSFELPMIGAIQAWMSAAAAVLLWVFALLFFREREGY